MRVLLVYADDYDEDSGTWQQEEVELPALPRIGDDFYDCRRPLDIRYTVRAVNHLLLPAGDPAPAVQVLIGTPDADPHPAVSRSLPRPSLN